ncbi:MAG TPA: phosphate propanoyltransferase [Candidatus Portnoybacteria bacterium]|nr:phosphate propanoyltransferase [Candidatus Portnoybacteria bacterium]
MKIPIEVSARHVHLSQEDLEKLFGPGAQLTKLKDLSQPGLFAAEETLTLANQELVIEKVRVVGPVRKQSQVELSVTDARRLKINPPLRVSGDLVGSERLILKGPRGTVELKEGVILAWRHLHTSPDEAQKLGLKNGDSASIKVKEDRALIFEKIVVRVDPNFRLALHIDTDEGNAAGIEQSGEGIQCKS